jgi:hypothetical protein
MVDWHNPSTIVAEYSTFVLHHLFFYQDLPVVLASRLGQAAARYRWGISVRLSNYCSSLKALDIPFFLSWEFICNLSFEWSLLRGRRQWRWTAAVRIPSFFSLSKYRFFGMTDAFCL